MKKAEIHIFFQNEFLYASSMVSSRPFSKISVQILRQKGKITSLSPTNPESYNKSVSFYARKHL